MIRKLSEVTWNYLPAVCRPSRRKNEMREICVRFQTDKGFMAFPSEKYFILKQMLANVCFIALLLSHFQNKWMLKYF